MSFPSARPRVLIVVAVPMTVKAFLVHYLQALAKDCDVTVVCSGEKDELSGVLPDGVVHVSIDIQRNIAPLRDLKSLLDLVKFVRNGQFDMLHSVTPKAGLLAQLAAWWCGIQTRVHTFTGQVWVTRRGISRAVLKMIDRLIAAGATHLLADSSSQRNFLISERVARPEKIKVLGHGSIAGVDAQRFQPNIEVRQSLRGKLGATDSDVLALFVGRLNRDKGVMDLVRAFTLVAERAPNLMLLLVGPDEGRMTSEIRSASGDHPRLHLLGETSRPEEYMAAADFFCLPSYREGFGSVVIEAAACSLPAMVSAIYGLTDAVEEGVTGLFHPPRDVDAIAALLEKLTMDVTLRRELGRQARERILADFTVQEVTKAQVVFAHALLMREK